MKFKSHCHQVLKTKYKGIICPLCSKPMFQGQSFGSTKTIFGQLSKHGVNIFTLALVLN